MPTEGGLRRRLLEVWIAAMDARDVVALIGTVAFVMVGYWAVVARARRAYRRLARKEAERAARDG